MRGKANRDTSKMREREKGNELRHRQSRGTQDVYNSRKEAKGLRSKLGDNC